VVQVRIPLNLVWRILLLPMMWMSGGFETLVELFTTKQEREFTVWT
jgi:hypothetical protein